MTPGRSIKPKQRRLSYPAPKPCPVCHAPMKPDGDEWRCDTHGKPTRP